MARIKENLQLDASDLATILVALRNFQEKYEGADAQAIYDDWAEHFTDEKGDKIQPLSTDDLEDLIENINCADTIYKAVTR